MVTFLGALATLIVGYIVYGTIVDRVFGRTGETAPSIRLEDGVDYIPLPTWKVFLIQLLNIAGLGPIFGALAGALWGPSVYLWIVFGTIFAGGVHDYLSGMISFREDGKSLSEIVGKNLGNIMLQIAHFLDRSARPCRRRIYDGTCNAPLKAYGPGNAHVAGRDLYLLYNGDPLAD